MKSLITFYDELMKLVVKIIVKLLFRKINNNGHFLRYFF